MKLFVFDGLTVCKQIINIKWNSFYYLAILETI